MGPIITVFVDINDEAGIEEMIRCKRLGIYAGSRFVRDNDGNVVGFEYQKDSNVLPIGCYFDLR